VAVDILFPRSACEPLRQHHAPSPFARAAVNRKGRDARADLLGLGPDAVFQFSNGYNVPPPAACPEAVLPLAPRAVFAICSSSCSAMGPRRPRKSIAVC
jgi:hypothetical protein